jgi:hypothetical protein
VIGTQMSYESLFSAFWNEYNNVLDLRDVVANK